MLASFSLVGQLAIVQGLDYSHTFEFSNDSGEPLDMSDRTAIAQLFHRGDKVADFVCDIDIGSINISLTAATTATLPLGMRGDFTWILVEQFIVDSKKFPLFRGHAEVQSGLAS